MSEKFVDAVIGPRIGGQPGAKAVLLGDPVYWDSGNSRWDQADASDESKLPRFFCVGKASFMDDGDNGLTLAIGAVVSDADAPYSTAGLQYLSETAGEITETRPASSGAVSIELGRAVDTRTVFLQVGAQPELGGGTLESGSVAIPALTFSADPDTGFYLSASNEIGITTAGTHRANFSTSVFNVIDNYRIAVGTGNDGVIMNRSTALGADTALSDVLIGTPVTPAIAADSMVISNITASGDILIAGNRGGNSEAYFFADTSAGALYLTQTGGLTLGLAADAPAASNGTVLIWQSDSGAGTTSANSLLNLMQDGAVYISLLTNSSSNAGLLVADGGGDIDAGRLFYNTGNEDWIFSVGDGSTTSDEVVEINTKGITALKSTDSAAVADEVTIGRYDIGAGNTVLALSQETAVATETDETKFSHKMQVRLNGATYFMMLTAS